MRSLSQGKLSLAVLALVGAWTATGCYKATVADTRYPDWAEAPRETRWESYFLWGLAGSNTEDAVAICHGDTPVMVRQDAGFLQYLVGSLTLGIYSPRRLVVACAPAGAPKVASNAGGGGR